MKQWWQNLQVKLRGYKKETNNIETKNETVSSAVHERCTFDYMRLSYRLLWLLAPNTCSTILNAYKLEPTVVCSSIGKSVIRFIRNSLLVVRTHKRSSSVACTVEPTSKRGDTTHTTTPSLRQVGKSASRRVFESNVRYISVYIQGTQLLAHSRARSHPQRYKNWYMYIYIHECIHSCIYTHVVVHGQSAFRLYLYRWCVYFSSDTSV